MTCFGLGSLQASFAIHLSPKGHTSNFVGRGGAQNVPAKATVPPAAMLERSGPPGAPRSGGQLRDGPSALRSMERFR